MADSNEVPWTSQVVNDKDLFLTRPWERFFRKIQDIVDYIKDEESFPLNNNQSVVANITPLTFDRRISAFAVVDYFVQRVHSGGVEHAKAGRLVCFYAPHAASWQLTDVVDVSFGTPATTFSITADGQVRYTTSNVAGVVVLSRITYRVRQMKAKSNLYSVMG